MSYLADGRDLETGESRVEGGFKTVDAAGRWAQAHLMLGWTVVREPGSCC